MESDPFLLEALAATRAQVARLQFLVWRASTILKLKVAGVHCEISAQGTPPVGHLPAVRSVGRKGRLVIAFESSVSFGSHVVIEHGGGTGLVSVGEQTSIGDHVRMRVSEDSRGPWEHRTDGGSIEIAARCQIRSYAIFRSVNRLGIGNDVMISHFCVLNCGSGTNIGDRSVLAERVTTADSDHTFDPRHTYHAPVTPGPIQIGPNVLVSANSVITRGVTLGEGTIVAANSIVTRPGSEPRTLIGGTPHRTLRRLDEQAPRVVD